MSIGFLRYQMLALALSFSATASAFAQEKLSYAIPWRNVAAKNCAVVLDRGNGLTDIILRCKGHTDIVVAEMSGEPK